MVAAKIDKGSVIRGIGGRGSVSKRALDPQFCAWAEAGYFTEAANRGIPLPEAMEQSRHRSVQQASSYYNNATRRSGRAARLL